MFVSNGKIKFSYAWSEEQCELMHDHFGRCLDLKADLGFILKFTDGQNSGYLKKIFRDF